MRVGVPVRRGVAAWAVAGGKPRPPTGCRPPPPEGPAVCPRRRPRASDIFGTRRFALLTAAREPAACRGAHALYAAGPATSSPARASPAQSVAQLLFFFFRVPAHSSTATTEGARWFATSSSSTGRFLMLRPARRPRRRGRRKKKKKAEVATPTFGAPRGGGADYASSGAPVRPWGLRDPPGRAGARGARRGPRPSPKSGGYRERSSAGAAEHARVNSAYRKRPAAPQTRARQPGGARRRRRCLRRGPASRASRRYWSAPGWLPVAAGQPGRRSGPCRLPPGRAVERAPGNARPPRPASPRSPTPRRRRPQRRSEPAQPQRYLGSHALRRWRPRPWTY